MSNYQTEDRTRLKRRWVDQAIEFAMENRWQEAVKVNESIIEFFPNDIEALNRLGRALMELGRYKEALSAYQRTLELDRSNLIANKNVRRLTHLTANAQSPLRSTPKRVDPRLFIAEEGKTGIIKLAQATDRAALDAATIGDQFQLTVDKRSLYITDLGGRRIGLLDPKASQRLIDLINGGNRYQAALMSVASSGEAKIFVREMLRHPNQAGKVSFPPRSGATGVRPYLRARQVKPDFEEEEDEEITEGADHAGEFDFEESEERLHDSDFDDDADTN